MSEPDARCPWCNAPAWAEFVDIGVGLQQVAPAEAECGACQQTDWPRQGDAEEQNFGWWCCDARGGS